MPTVLYESRHVRLELDDTRRLLRFTRTAVPFTSLDEATEAFRLMGQATTGIDRRRYVLLSDVRAVIGRNDEAFETVIGKARADLLNGFGRRAVLVRTLTGKLQVQRIGRQQHNPEAMVFQDEAEALAYLVGPR
jgi:hypothetical protein